MLKIRKDQQDELLKSQQHEFHKKVLASLRRSLPEQTAQFDDETLLGRIREAHGAATGYDVTTEYGITQFVTLSVLAGAEFHKRDAMQTYLRRQDISGDQKMRLLVNMLEFLGERGK